MAQISVSPSPVQAPGLPWRPAKFTCEDYHQMIEAGILADRPVELLNGIITEMTPESPLHADTIRHARRRLNQQLGDRADLSIGHPISLGQDSEPQPDIALIEFKRYPDRHPQPDEIYLVIEFSNTTLNTDRAHKRRLYANHQIREHWIVNLNDRQLWVYREPDQGDYQVQLVFQPGDQVSPIAFPDVILTVADLLSSR